MTGPALSSVLPVAPGTPEPAPQAPTRPATVPTVSQARYNELRDSVNAMIVRGATPQSVQHYLDLELGTRPVTPPSDPAPDTIETGFVRGMSMAMLQGVTFGFGDEALGALSGTLAGVGARAGIDQYRAEYDAWRSVNRKKALAAEVVGAIPTAFLTAGAAPLTVGRTLGLGAAVGAVSGAGNAQGDFSIEGLSERARSALLGAGLGAATAGVLRGAVAVAAPVIQAGARALTRGAPRLQEALPGIGSPEGRARQWLAETLASENLSPAAMMTRAQALTATGAPAVTLDVAGDATLQLAARAAQMRSPLKTEAVEMLLTRQAQQPERVAGAFAQLVGAGKFGMANAYELEDAVRKTALTQARPFYEKAFGETVQITPRLREILSHPRFRAAYDIGRSLADDEALAGIGHGLDIPKLPAPDLIESLIARGVPPGRARVLADDMFPSELPIRALDYAKRGLDVIVDKGLKREGALDRRAAQALMTLRNEVRDELKSQSPSYEAALSLYAGAQEFADALVAGQGFLRASPGALARDIAKLSPNERDAFRVGAAQAMYEHLLGATNAAGKAGGSLFGTKTPMSERVRAMFPDAPDVAEHFIRTVNAEARLSFTTQRVATRAPSVSPQGIEQALEGGVPMVRSGLGLTLLSAGRAAVVRTRGQLDSEVGDELTRLFVKGAQGPDELYAFISGLDASMKALRRARVTQTGAAIASGTLGGKGAGSQQR